MPNKKIFFSYADSEMEQNAKLIQAIKLHFSRLKGNADLIFKEEQFAVSADKKKIIEMIENADCKVHLLSINYANEDSCMEELKVSMQKEENTFPILLSSFFWDENSPFEKIENKILPGKDAPLETESNINTSLMKLVKSVAEEGLGIKKMKNEKIYYYVLASIVFALGIISSILIYKYLNDIIPITRIIISSLSFIMFLCISLFIMIKVWRPTSISLFNF